MIQLGFTPESESLCSIQLAEEEGADSRAEVGLPEIFGTAELVGQRGEGGEAGFCRVVVTDQTPIFFPLLFVHRGQNKREVPDNAETLKQQLTFGDELRPDHLLFVGVNVISTAAWSDLRRPFGIGAVFGYPDGHIARAVFLQEFFPAADQSRILFQRAVGVKIENIKIFHQIILKRFAGEPVRSRRAAEGAVGDRNGGIPRLEAEVGRLAHRGEFPGGTIPESATGQVGFVPELPDADFPGEGLRQFPGEPVGGAQIPRVFMSADPGPRGETVPGGGDADSRLGEQFRRRSVPGPVILPFGRLRTLLMGAFAGEGHTGQPGQFDEEADPFFAFSLSIGGDGSDDT